MTRRMIVEDARIDDESKCYVIAEIGHNHQGSLEKCKELFRAARDCGVDAVKLQKRDNRTLFTRQMYDSPYDHRNSYAPTYGAHREALEFGRDDYLELQRYARELGVLFFSTAFDIPSAHFLAALDMPAYKIASGDLTNIPLIREVARIGRPVFISTGGGTMDDVRRAHDAVMPINDNVCIMQCTSGYPVEYDELNLRVIETFRREFPNCVIGFSAHDNGISMPVVGYMLGARVIEKHFTLNRAAKGTDHAFSLEPPGLRRMVRDLGRARIALGDGVKRRFESETQPLYKMAKKLVAARAIPAGTTLGLEDIAIRSPNDGLPPFELDNVIGRITSRALEQDENIDFAALD